DVVRAADAVRARAPLHGAGAADRGGGVEAAGGGVVEVGGRAIGDVEGAAVAGDVAEVEDRVLHQELAAALQRQRHVERRSARPRALLDRAAVDDRRRGASVQENAAVALQIDRAAVGQHGVVLQVGRAAGGDVDRAGVAHRTGIDDDPAVGNGGDVRDGELPAAADGSAGPAHGRAGDGDRRGAVEDAALHGERRYAHRAGAVERERAAVDEEAADAGDVADGGGGAVLRRAGDVVDAADAIRARPPSHGAGAADGGGGVEAAGGGVVEVGGRAGGDVEGPAVAGDVAEVEDRVLHEELAAALQ